MSEASSLLVIIIIQLACAYNVDDLYHTGRIDPRGTKRSSILYARTILTPDIYVAIRFT